MARFRRLLDLGNGGHFWIIIVPYFLDRERIAAIDNYTLKR